MLEMKRIEWDRMYSIGVPEIDGHHQAFMDLLNEAMRNSSGNKAEERIFFDKKTEKIMEFVKAHYAAEEQYLSKTNYEKYTEHVLEHEYILQILRKIKDDIIHNKVEMDLFKITMHLKEVFLNHIKFYDKGARVHFFEGKNEQYLQRSC